MTTLNPLSIVILAAGQGKRMYSQLPKVLHPLAGQPLLAHVLACAQRLSPQKIVVVYGHGGTQVQAAFADASIEWAHQAEQKGTGHALQCALPQLPEDGYTLVLYGDVPLIQTATLQAMCAEADGGVVLLTDTLAHPQGYGRIVRQQGKVQRIVEDKDANAAEKAIQEINTGMLLLPNTHLRGWLSKLKNTNAQGEYYLTDVIALAVADGLPIHTVQPQYHWEAEGVNNKVQLAQLERAYQQQYAHQLLSQGVTLADPARIDIRGTLKCAQDVRIDVGCVFEGHVELQNDVQIGAYCVIKNSQILAGAKIAPYSHIEGATVGEAAKVGPFARLRTGAQLAAHSHIGNFVEIKNSQIGEGSKVNHLSYVGDADVGKRVNIGAGTITCNYDGVNKFRTTIEDGVFVGSGSMLVAPVTLGEGATIGAGSTITKPAAAGELTLERSKQITIKGWQRPVKKT